MQWLTRKLQPITSTSIFHTSRTYWHRLKMIAWLRRWMLTSQYCEDKWRQLCSRDDSQASAQGKISFTSNGVHHDDFCILDKNTVISRSIMICKLFVLTGSAVLKLIVSWENIKKPQIYTSEKNFPSRFLNSWLVWALCTMLAWVASGVWWWRETGP